MADALSICNLGLGKISASTVTNLTPPRSGLEKHCSAGYPVWRDSELQKRVWYFAKKHQILTLSGEDDSLKDGRKYKFAVPTDNIKLLRDKYTRWEQRGQHIWHSANTLTVEYVWRVPEALFDALFVDVLACRVGLESVEYATQSNTKGDSIQDKYNRAVMEAAKANAFVIGPQDVSLADENSEWVTARWS